MDSLHVKDGTDELHKEDLESSPKSEDNSSELISMPGVEDGNQAETPIEQANTPIVSLKTRWRN